MSVVCHNNENVFMFVRVPGRDFDNRKELLTRPCHSYIQLHPSPSICFLSSSDDLFDPAIDTGQRSYSLVTPCPLASPPDMESVVRKRLLYGRDEGEWLRYFSSTIEVAFFNGLYYNDVF